MTLGANTVLSTTNNAINLAGGVSNSIARSLTISTGNAAITLSGNIGSGTALNALTLNSTGTTTLGTIGNAINTATITTNTGGSTVINSDSLTTTGTQTYNDAVSFGGGTASRLLSALGITFASTLNASSNDLAIQADTMTFGGAGTVTGTGGLRLAAQAASGTIGVNLASGSTLNITSTNLAALGTGFSILNIGQSGQSGTITVPTSTFSVPTQITSSSSISASGTISASGSNSLTLNGPVTLTAPTTFSSGSGNVNLSNTVTGGGFSLAASTSGSGVITFGNVISGISSLTATGSTAINTTNITSSASQTYNSPVTLGADTTLATVGISFLSTVAGNGHSLAITVSGTDATILGSLTGLSSLQISNVNKINFGINNINITTTGAQTYNGRVWLVSSPLVTFTGAGITFGGEFAGFGHNTVINDSGTTAFNGIVTGFNTLQANAVAFNSSSGVTTTGTQSYGAATLGADTTLTGAGITLSSVTGGSKSLTLADSGTSILGGAISGLSTLQTNAVTLNNGSISSTGNQIYNGAVSLGATTLLTSSNGNISLNSTLIGGSQSLTLTGSSGGSHVFTLNDISSLGTLAINGNSSVTNTLALLSGSGTNTWTVTNNGGSGGSNGTIAATNITSGGTFNNIQNLTSGTATNNFVFNNGAAISGNIINSGTGSLNFSAYTTAVSINATTNTSTGIGGTFSGITTFTGGSGSNTFTNTAGSNTWSISNNNIGSVAGKNFNAFGTLAGGSGDTFTLGDGKSIGSISATAGTLNYTNYSTAVSVNATTSSGTNVGSFSGITTFTGGSGSNTFTNTTGSSTWNISNDNAGSIAGKNFSAFATLVGGSGDTFTLGDGKSIGSISATAGTLNYSNYSTAVAVNGGTNTATNVGSLSGITSFTGGSGSNTFTNAAGSNTWNISNDNAGSIAGKNFSAFATLVGGSGDTFTLGDGKSIGSISATAGTLNYTNYSTGVSVNATTSSGTNVGSFSGITTFTGGSGSNTFTNTAGSSTWNISNDNAGSIAGKNFSAFATLVGGSGDTFTLGDGKSIGSISATAGTLNYINYSTAVSVNATTSSGTNVGSFSGITTFTGGSGSNTFTNTAGSNTWSISDNNIGSVAGKNFNAFATLTGGSGDTFALANGKSIGSISATAGTLDYSAYTTAVAVNGATNTATNVGSLSGITTFTGGSGSNTFTNTTGSNTWSIANNNAGSISGKNFNAFGTLIGGNADTFVFGSSSAAITGNLTSSGNATLNVSGLTSPTVNLSTNTSNAIGGIFSGISTFIGSGTSSSLIGPSSNTTWNINSANGGTAGTNTFTGFGNLTGGSGTNNFVLSGGSIGGSINGGSSSNTLTIPTGTTNWTISGTDAGSVASMVGGFSNIQNLTGGTGTDTFTFTGNGSISGLIDGGDTTTMNTIDYSGYTQPVALTLATPTVGDEFNTGTIDNNASIRVASFTQVQQALAPIGSTIILPNNKANISITYTNDAHTDGFIGDPFFFTNFRILNPPAPPVIVPIDIAQIITPFTQTSSNNDTNNDDDTTSSTTTSGLPQTVIVEQSINDMLEQQASVDQKTAQTLAVGCFAVQ